MGPSNSCAHLGANKFLLTTEQLFMTSTPLWSDGLNICPSFCDLKFEKTVETSGRLTFVVLLKLYFVNITIIIVMMKALKETSAMLTEQGLESEEVLDGEEVMGVEGGGPTPHLQHQASQVFFYYYYYYFFF